MAAYAVLCAMCLSIALAAGTALSEALTALFAVVIAALAAIP
jgi:hypothetical protein